MQRFKYIGFHDRTFIIEDTFEGVSYDETEMEDFCELANSLNSSLVFTRDTRDKVLNEYNPKYVINIIENMIMDYQAKSIQAMEECRSNRDFHVAQFTLRELIKRIKEGV